MGSFRTTTLHTKGPKTATTTNSTAALTNILAPEKMPPLDFFFVCTGFSDSDVDIFIYKILNNRKKRPSIICLICEETFRLQHFFTVPAAGLRRMQFLHLLFCPIPMGTTRTISSLELIAKKRFAAFRKSVPRSGTGNTKKKLRLVIEYDKK